MSDPRRIVITGARGHVGGRLLRHLCSTSNESIRPHFRNAVELPPWASTCSPTFGDLRERSVRARALCNTDVVVHLATRGYSAARPPTLEELADEHTLTYSVVREAVEQSVPKFVYVSSIHVYGTALTGEVTEHTQPRPDGEYGRARLQLEHDVMSLCRESQTSAVIIRMSNTFGVPAFDNPPTWDLLVHDLCRQAVLTNELRLRTKGNVFRNLLALRDAVSVIAQVASRQMPSGVYLLGGNTTRTLHDIAEEVRQNAQVLLQKEINLEALTSETVNTRPFALNSASLRSHGISIEDTFSRELADLVRCAQMAFGGNTSQ